MTFTVKLDNPHRRFAAILSAVVVASAFVWLIISHFIVRVVADSREAFTQGALVAFAARFPSSARINFRLADAEVVDTTSNGQFNAQAEAHAMRALKLSPWDYQAQRLLAVAQELNGKQEEAEQSLRAAVKLAPNHGELNWSFANLLLRRGKLNESLVPFRVASASSLGLLPSAIETIWQSSGGDLGVLKSFAGNDPEMQLSIVKFLTEQNLTSEAVAIYNSIGKEAKVSSPRSPELINALMRAGQVELARATWVELVSALQPAPEPAGGLVWNGGFEQDAVAGFNHFDWVINPNQYARIVIDRNFARSGARSLKVVFSGLDTTKLQGEVRQAILLKPGARYRLECYAKASDLLTPEGPRIAVIGQNDVIAASAPVAAGSTDWQPLTVDFVAPANSASAFVHVIRIPKFSYDDPTRGIVWFDDFTLVEQ